MNVLALEGALGTFSIAIARDGRVVARRSEDGRRALESGLALVESAMRDAEARPESFDCIAVGNGPGGFTGLRIAISYAKALAIAWRLPLVAVSSYDLLEGDASAPVLTVVRGRTGVVCARFRAASSVATACGPPAEVVRRLVGRERSIALAGDAEDVREALAERDIAVHIAAASNAPADALALLAQSCAPASSPDEGRPEYGELPAVKPPRERDVR